MSNPTGSRDSRGRYTPAVETRLRDAEAARLHSLGWTYSRIGEFFKVDKSSAWSMVQRALHEAGKATRESVLRDELTRIAARRAEVTKVLTRRHILVSQGRVVLDPETGEPLEDDGPILAASAELDRLADLEAKLVGAYAPSRSQVQVITEDVVDAEIARLSAELEQRSTTA